MAEHDVLHLRPAPRERVVDEVRRSIEEAILIGQMPPGTRLVEQMLAEQLQVSRTTVREALLMLRQDGLAVSKPRGGTFVVRVSPEDESDLRLTRALLEGFAVRTRITSLDREVGAELAAIADAMGACGLPQGLPRLIELDIAFHRVIMARAHAPLMMETWAGLNGAMRALFVTRVDAGVITGDRVGAVHARIVAELCSGDAARAARAVVNHYLTHTVPPERANLLRRAFGIPEQ